MPPEKKDFEPAYLRTFREGKFEEKINKAEDNEAFLIVIMEAVEALQNRHTWVMSPTDVSSQYYLLRILYPIVYF